MQLVWEESVWEDYLYWQLQDRKILRRINQIIADIRRNESGRIRENLTHSNMDCAVTSHVDALLNSAWFIRLLMTAFGSNNINSIRSN
ncbi:type II toxin-antitoxin system YoeB family toxin [Mycobacterium uberis]|uniref:type II toxin-antitoxin system YoeB family toxin n=1 Tax=Mycobacterium uberis TaxID=2162698 RepID=UPI0026CF812B